MIKLILKRLDENTDSYEILFLATFDNYDQGGMIV